MVICLSKFGLFEGCRYAFVPLGAPKAAAPPNTVRAAFLVSANFSGGNPLSSSATHARPGFARRAAAPVLCGAATVAAVSMPATSMAATQVHTGPNAANADNAVAAPALKYVPKHAKKAASEASSYTVKSGDSLSSIARHYYQSAKFWPAIYWANHHAVRYANDIQSGQVLKVPAKPSSIPDLPSTLSAPAPVHHYAPEATTSAVTESAPVQTESVSASSGASGFQQCVISRESGGNSQAMNSSGHYGLYQFSSSTWSAYGGNPADFGHASTSEQNRVFDNAMAQGGRSNWAPYDGC